MIRRRAAFTLIELMIVIVIIAILLAILVPTVMGAMRTAREASVKTEITALSSAVADFKAQFGMNPPSYVDFRLHSIDSSGKYVVDPAGDYVHPRTQGILKRIWPNFNLSPTGPFIADLKANTAKQIQLNGSQCLVFFLGGMVPSAGEVPVGFSSNPRNPLILGGKRVGPFFEFRTERLYDADPATFNGYDGYLDPLPGQLLPYWYVTADRYSAQETANALLTAMPAAAAMRPVYKQSASSYFNAGAFQIVSPGPDGATGENASLPGGAYGAGGTFDAKAGTIVDNLPGSHALKGQAKGDGDNITSFHGGKLL